MTKKKCKTDVLIQIQLLKDGSVQVVDGEQNPLPAMTPEEFSSKLPGKVIKKSHLCTILYTNPCGWVFIDGEWRYECW